MIVCPNCNHQNPEGSLQCENCYTPLPATASCPNCGASVQTDATFCGQCGFNLQAENLNPIPDVMENIIGSSATPQVEEPEQFEESQETAVTTPAMTSPITSPWDEDDEQEDLTFGQIASPASQKFEPQSETEEMGDSQAQPDLDISLDGDLDSETMPWDLPDENVVSSSGSQAVAQSEPELDSELPPPFPIAETEVATSESVEAASINVPEPTIPKPSPPPWQGQTPAASSATQLQIQKVSLIHLQTNSKLELPQSLDVIHIGKPNSQIPPDIDVAGFPDSEVVSRVHADIRVEGDAYFIEDVGSSNGTYINHTPLLPGNRHRLRAGDRISLGKGDLVTFIFQLS